MRGREQVENMRANRQTRELNDLRLQSERDRIDQEKIARGAQKAFGALYQKHKGNLDLAEQEARTATPEYALPLAEMFAKYKALQGQKRKDELELQTLEQKSQEPEVQKIKQMAYLLGMQPNELMREQQEQQMFPRPLTQLQANVPLDGSPEQLQAYGLGPEKYAEIQAKQGATPSNLQVFNAYKNMTPEERELYQEAIRSQQWQDFGSYKRNVVTGEIINKGVPIQETPSYKATVAGAVEGAKLQEQNENQVKKPLSGDAAKVATIAQSMIPEAQQLIEMYKKNPKETLAKIKTGWGDAGRLADQVADKLGRMRSGGAVNKDEESRFKGQIARFSDAVTGPESAIKALNSLIDEAKGVSSKMITDPKSNKKDPLGLGL
jgi:hypothetical protein